MAMADARERARPNEPTVATESSSVTRVLAWVVLAVMAVALIYAGWIALANFNRIGV